MCSVLHCNIMMQVFCDELRHKHTNPCRDDVLLNIYTQQVPPDAAAELTEETFEPFGHKRNKCKTNEWAISDTSEPTLANKALTKLNYEVNRKDRGLQIVMLIISC